MSGQRLMVNAAGSAVRGIVNINSSWANNIGSLVVPSGVQANTLGFNSSTPLNVTGAANILGSVFNLQTAPNVTAVLNLGSLNVYDLCDKHNGDVTFVSNKRSVDLVLGQQVVLTRQHHSTFEDVNPGMKIGFRNVSNEEMGDGITASLAEFPLGGLLLELKHSVVNLQNDKSELSSVTTRILKTAVAVQMSTMGHGAYKTADQNAK